MNYLKELEKAKKDNISFPKEFRHALSSAMYFKYNMGRYYIFFNQENKEIEIYDNISMQIDKKHNKVIKEQIKGRIPKLKNSEICLVLENETLLFLDDNCFKIVLLVDNIYYILETFKIDKDTYFEYDSTLKMVMFGDRKTYFKSFETEMNNFRGYKVIDFYQNFLEVQFDVRKKEREL